MPYIKFVPTVVVPKTVIIACAVINAATALHLSEDMYVTSGNDSTHMTGSKHYTDCALDIRTKHLKHDEKMFLLAEVKHRLGKDYDAILESLDLPNEHLHIEYDPK